MYRRLSRRRLFLVVSCLVLTAAVLAACGEGDGLTLPETGQHEQPMNGQVTYYVNSNCSPTEQLLVAAGASVAYNKLVANAGDLRANLADRFVVTGGYFNERFLDRMSANNSTAVKCVPHCNGEDTCSPGYQSNEDVSFTHDFLDQYKYDLNWIGARFLAEVAATKGHGTNFGVEVPYSMRQQVAYAADPAKDPGTTRRSDLRGEVELAPINSHEQESYATGCDLGGFVRGMDVGWVNHYGHPTVRALQGYCDPVSGSGSSVFHVGSLAGTTSSYVACPSGYRATGVYGRANYGTSQLGLLCTSSSTIAAGQPSTHTPAPLGGSYDASNLDFTRKCPDGMAVAGIRYGMVYNTNLMTLRFRCRAVDETRAGNYTTGFALGDTNSYWEQFGECTGFGALNGIYGRSGAEIDSLGGYCVGTKKVIQRAGTYLYPDYGTEHLLRAYGGSGGYDYSLKCPTNELVVGIAVDYGDRINALRAICSNPVSWENSSSPTTTWTPWTGGSGGTFDAKLCQHGSYVVGIDVTKDAGPYPEHTVHGVKVRCRDLF